jgi:hypothetical protein
MPYHATGVKALTARPLSRVQAARLSARIQRVRNRMERWLVRQYASLLSDLEDRLGRAHGDADILDAWTDYQESRREMLTRFYSNLYPEIASFVVDDDTLKAWGTGIEAKDRQEDLDTAIRAWIEDIVGERITDNGHAWGYAQSHLSEIRSLYAQAEGDPIRFRDLLRDSGLFGSVASRRIAVTETTAGLNQCLERTSRAYSGGRTLVKTWRTTGSLNVRDTHKMMNGVTIPDDELFEVPTPSGGTDRMAYPGDSSHGASAANIVNCHCVCLRSYRD